MEDELALAHKDVAELRAQSALAREQLRVASAQLRAAQQAIEASTRVQREGQAEVAIDGVNGESPPASSSYQPVPQQRSREWDDGIDDGGTDADRQAFEQLLAENEELKRLLADSQSLVGELRRQLADQSEQEEASRSLLEAELKRLHAELEAQRSMPMQTLSQQPEKVIVKSNWAPLRDREGAAPRRGELGHQVPVNCSSVPVFRQVSRDLRALASPQQQRVPVSCSSVPVFRQVSSDLPLRTLPSPQQGQGASDGGSSFSLSKEASASGAAPGGGGPPPPVGQTGQVFRRHSGNGGVTSPRPALGGWRPCSAWPGSAPPSAGSRAPAAGRHARLRGQQGHA